MSNFFKLSKEIVIGNPIYAQNSFSLIELKSGIYHNNAKIIFYD